MKWHNVAPVNGRVMDIEDWRTTHERYLQVGEYRAELAILAKTEFPDSRHMVWTLKAPNGALADRIWSNQFAYPIVAKELNVNPRLAESTLPISTGYKIFDKNLPSITIEYRKNPDYWGGDPFIDRWHMPIIPEYSNRYAQFVAGNIMDFTPTARDVLLLAKDAPGAVIVANEIPDENISRHLFGAKTPQAWPWADPRVRIAIRRSIDWKSIAYLLSAKAELEAAGIAIDVSPMTHLNQNPAYWLNPELGELGSVSANYLYDPAEAKKLTAAAGFRDLVELPMIVQPASDGGAAADNSQLIIDSLKRSGAIDPKVNVTQTQIEWRDLRTRPVEFDGMLSEQGNSNDPDRFIFRDFHSQGNLPRSPQAYPDPRFDAIADAQRAELDLQKRYGILKDFQLLAAELMPTVPSRHLTTTFQFRWPWLHNIAYGSPDAGSPPPGKPIPGGHLHWLSADICRDATARVRRREGGAA